MELATDTEVIDNRAISIGMRHQRLGAKKKGVRVMSMTIVQKIVRVADMYSNNEVTDRQPCFRWPRGGATCCGEYVRNAWCPTDGPMGNGDTTPMGYT